ncbi:hypothetical protein F0562_001684 [Nyssa sinensis]|uniref:Uncharacterized protein n=1 Tax=Nyssa sinensis TaxID=561372 RepID=A0A5J5C7N9_9ASTE|nr:hypothetical protein F0562_001684 [Nyssa sinensis]
MDIPNLGRAQVERAFAAEIIMQVMEDLIREVAEAVYQGPDLPSEPEVQEGVGEVSEVDGKTSPVTMHDQETLSQGVGQMKSSKVMFLFR